MWLQQFCSKWMCLWLFPPATRILCQVLIGWLSKAENYVVGILVSQAHCFDIDKKKAQRDIIIQLYSRDWRAMIFVYRPGLSQNILVSKTGPSKSQQSGPNISAHTHPCFAHSKVTEPQLHVKLKLLLKLPLMLEITMAFTTDAIAWTAHSTAVRN